MSLPISFVVRCLTLALSASAAPWLVATALAQTDAHLGKWTLNANKSVFSPGPPPRSQVRIYTLDGDKLKATIETLQPLGIKTVVLYTAGFDGKDYPITGNSEINTIALKRIDQWTFDATLKRSGKVITTTRNNVSQDGRIMTVTAQGTTPRGQPTKSVAIFNRQ